MVCERILDNGIKLVMEDLPFYRSVSIGVWIRTGSMYETVSNNGMAHVIEHMLFKGTSRRTAAALADEMTALGGNMDAFTCKDCTCYYAKTLDIYLENALDILSDMLMRSLFDENELKKELGVILEEIDLYEDSPEDIVHEHLQMEVWKNHPLGFLISGKKDTVKKFSRQDVLDFYNKFYVGSNMVISLAGNFEAEKTEGLIRHLFGGLEKGQSSETGESPVYTPCIWSRPKEIEQNHLTLAFPCCGSLSPLRYAMTVTNSLLGGNMNSRLFMKIRDEMGLTYSIYSYGSSFPDAGLFQIYAAMNPEYTQAVIQEIFSEVEKIKKEGFSDKELEVAKSQILAELVIDSESTYNRMSSNGKNVLVFGHVISMEKELDNIKHVTMEDVLTFIQEVFVKEKCSAALAGETGYLDTKSSL